MHYIDRANEQAKESTVHHYRIVIIFFHFRDIHNQAVKLSKLCQMLDVFVPQFLLRRRSACNSGHWDSGHSF